MDEDEAAEMIERFKARQGEAPTLLPQTAMHVHFMTNRQAALIAAAASSIQGPVPTSALLRLADQYLSWLEREAI